MSTEDPFGQEQKPAAPADDATRYRRAAPNPAPEVTVRRPLNASRHLEPGQILAHTYEIEARLARGGMGEVYRARNIKLGTLHAIKVIAPELISDARVVEMFTEEARKLRMVRHDAVVSYDGLIGDEEGLLYLIMEFVDGVSLAKVIRERSLGADELRGLRDRLAQGLGAAHDKLIYHRDISPDNIILVDGRVEQAKIIDFGIAKSAAAGDRTVVGSDFAGKYSYVSPEQLGMFGGQIDGRSDIYSLGLVLATAGLGHALAMGDSPATAVEARRSVPDLAALPAALRAEIEPLLEPDPANRPRSMRELPSGTDDQAPPKVVPRRPPPKGPARQPPVTAKRSPLPFILGGLVGLIAVTGGAAYFLWPSTPPAPSSAVTAPSLPSTPPSLVTSLPNTTGTSPPASPPAAASSPPETVATLPPPLITPTNPSAPDPQVVTASLAKAALSLRCADLKADLANAAAPGVVGFVSSGTDRDRLSQMLSDVPSLQSAVSTITVRPWPQCDQLLKVVADAGALGNAAAAPRLDFNIPSRNYHLGDKLVLRVAATAGGFLYVDFVDSAGNVAHLLPRPQGPSNAVRAGQTVTLGESKDSVLEIAEPLGPNLVLAIFSPQRLFAARDDETAQTYVPVLGRSLSAAHASASYAFVYALPR